MLLMRDRMDDHVSASGQVWITIAVHRNMVATHTALRRRGLQGDGGCGMITRDRALYGRAAPR